MCDELVIRVAWIEVVLRLQSYEWAKKKQTSLLRNVTQSLGWVVRKYLGNGSGNDEMAHLRPLFSTFVTKSYACDQVAET